MLAHAPRHFDALLFLGVIACQDGRHAQALQLIGKALEIDPAHAAAHSNLGIALEGLGETERAAAAHRRALALRPDFADAHANLGSLLAARGEREEAAACFERALKLRPDHPLILTNLGNVLRELGRLAEAEDCHRRSIAAEPRRAVAHASLGHVLQARGRRADAIACYRHALALSSRSAETLCDLGNALSEEDALEEAIDAYRRALSLKPDYARAHSHLGNALMRTGRLKEAQATLEEAMRLKPDSPLARLTLSHLRMMQGDYSTGLPLYESRFQEKVLSKEFAPMYERAERLARTPRWHGGDARGCSLLVWADQGLGDTLMMLRYLPMLKTRGVGRLAVYCEAPLVRVVQSLPQVDEVIAASAPPPAGRFDLHCPIMSLPLMFGTRLETIPRSVPYLQVPEPRAAMLCGVARPRVGLLWAGGAHNPRDHLRSIPLQRFAPLLAIPGVSFVSLQKGDAAAQIGASGLPLVERMDECRDFLDTAGLLDELDLLISVDSAVAHLGGALGRPVWLLNRFESEWRWLFEGDEAPWYPTIRILRQPRAGDWDSVIARAASELRDSLADLDFGVRRH